MSLKQTYVNRNKRLRKAGFETYQDFLNSDTWKEIRSRLKITKCVICGTKHRLEAHHYRYTKITKNAHNIHILCRDCHQSIHNISNLDEIKDATQPLKKAKKKYSWVIKLFYNNKSKFKQLNGDIELTLKHLYQTKKNRKFVDHARQMLPLISTDPIYFKCQIKQ